MLNLNDQNISYLLFSPENETLTSEEKKLVCEKACSILYSKDYTILSVKGLYEGVYENSFLALQNKPNNDDLRKDLIYLLEIFHQQSGIVKYKNETKATKVFESGFEKPLSILLYDLNSNNKTYLYNGISFSFLEEKRYYFPKTINDLRNGMILEFFNNKEWVEKEIQNVQTEYDNLYKLLMKYDKVRISVG